MSGVLLVLAPSLPRSEIEALLQRLADPMAHRATDGADREMADGIGLSLQHMAITPEDAKIPPVAQSDDLWVALDGRIDDRGRLAAALGVSEASSDATLVAAAYRRWGRAFCEHVHGEASGVVVEPERRRMLAFRDRMGVRPLYWHARPGLLLVASEPSAILAHPDVPRGANLAAVAEMLANRHHERRETLWRGVEAVPLAHWLAAEEAEPPKLGRYHRLDPWRRLPDGDAGDYVEAIRETFAVAVADRLRSTRPLAIAVSGGIDSSSILGQAEQLRRSGVGPRPPMRAYHFVYPGTSAHEAPYAEAVAEMWRVPFETLAPLDHPEWADPSLPTLHPDSFFDPRERAFVALADEAKRHGIRSIFTGNVVDVYVRSTGDELADALAGGRPREVLQRLAGRGARGSARELLSALRRLVPRNLREASRRLRPTPRHPWLTPAAARLVVERADALERELDLRRWPDRVTRDICADLEGSRIQPVLASLDRVAAKVGTEVLSPWQDLRLVELLLAIPHRYREAPPHGGPQKPILRLALGHLVPERTRRRVDHPDIGEPLTIWFFDHHQTKIRRLFEKSRLVEAGLVNAHALRSISPSSDTGAIMRLIAMERLLRDLD
ncbi:MAG: asparagine synthase-related protein [Polyangiaceae bacterium]